MAYSLQWGETHAGILKHARNVDPPWPGIKLRLKEVQRLDEYICYWFNHTLSILKTFIGYISANLNIYLPLEKYQCHNLCQLLLKYVNQKFAEACQNVPRWERQHTGWILFMAVWQIMCWSQWCPRWSILLIYDVLQMLLTWNHTELTEISCWAENRLSHLLSI